MSTPASISGLVWKAPHEVIPSPENRLLYTDAAESLDELATHVGTHGIREPLMITRDAYIVSGHRRREAALRAGLERLPCYVLPMRRADIPKDAYIRLLREHNRQRSKCAAELIAEARIDADPEVAYRSLVEGRVQRVLKADGQFGIEGVKQRSEISERKTPFLNAAMKVIVSLQEYYPLTIRQIHYVLVGERPLRNTARPESAYANDRGSYQDLSDLLTRARISGQVPWESIKDDTRPVRLWSTHPHVGQFVQAELTDLFGDYWRDLQQSQPNHLEIFVEKNSSLSVIDQLGMKYCIPITSGRGNSSKPPLNALARRFEDSQKHRLVLLLLSDFDPDGDSISNSTAKCLRDDHGIPNDRIVPVRVAIRPDQIQRFGLPKSLEAKATSSNFNKFVAKHGVTYAVELEALPPRHLQAELDRAIRAHLDVDLFNREVAMEKREAASLQALKARTLRLIQEVDR